MTAGRRCLQSGCRYLQSCKREATALLLAAAVCRYTQHPVMCLKSMWLAQTLLGEGNRTCSRLFHQYVKMHHTVPVVLTQDVQSRPIISEQKRMNAFVATNTPQTIQEASRWSLLGCRMY